MKRCTSCGADISSDDYFCSECGHEISIARLGQNKTFNWVIWTAIIIFALFGTAYGNGLWLFAADEKEVAENEVTMDWRGGSYIGEVRNNMPHGKGTTWTSHQDGAKYVGEWRDGDRHGEGRMTWHNGDEYVGEWRDDKRHGKGRMSWSDGIKWSGEWNDDEKVGNPVLTGRYTGIPDPYPKRYALPDSITKGARGGRHNVID